MDLLEAIQDSFRNPTVPANRVFRKVISLTVMLIIYLIYTRHVAHGFVDLAHALLTLLISFTYFVFLGIIGGIFAGGFYESFLDNVRAQVTKPSITTFFAEWLFALTAPLFAFLISLFFLAGGEQ